MKRGICILIGVFVFIAYCGAQAIYDPTLDVKEAIGEALETAKTEGKAVLLEFGADWCPDCINLAKMSETEELSEYLEEKYIVVRIDVGRRDRNVDVAETYGVPLKKGIPSLAILDVEGKVKYVSQNGEWANARKMKAEEMLKMLKEIGK
jgi:thioredoxin 1